jgi:hypothetical protein
MAEREIARKINIAWAINTKKDYCKVGKDIIPFDIVCDLSKATSYSKNVTANGKAVLSVDHVIPGMVGNAGSGIESGVSGLAGTVVLTNGSPTVTTNDKSTVRHGDDCKMNCDAAKKSNVPGKIYTSAYLAALSSQAHNIDNPVLRNLALANLQVEQWKQQARDEFVRGTAHFFKSTKDSLVTLSDATGITGTSAESQAARGRMLAGVEAIGTLMGPPPEMVQGAYMSGNAEYIAQIEQMQRNQQAAWGQVGNSIATAWTDANARSGPVGAATMVFTALGWNVAAGAATGVGVGVAARIAVNVGGKVLQVSAGVGRTIAEALALSKNSAQAVKALDDAIVAAKAAGASADDIAALAAAKEAVLKGPPAPKAPAGSSPANGTVVKAMNLIEERQAANAKLRGSEQYAKDKQKVAVTDEQIAAMEQKKVPLGFKNEAQLGEFKGEMNSALDKAGLADSEIGLKGTSTTFYSENPGKPLGHHWDADLKNPGDYDLNITSRSMVDRMESAGISPHDKYNVFRTSDIEGAFPELRAFREKWSTILGREVNFVGYPSSTARDATEFILRGKK